VHGLKVTVIEKAHRYSRQTEGVAHLDVPHLRFLYLDVPAAKVWHFA